MIKRKGLKESVTLTDEAVVDDNTVVVFSTHIPNNGIAGSIQASIRDIEKYNENRTEIRRIQREFEDDVWDKEDEMNAKATEE